MRNWARIEDQERMRACGKRDKVLRKSYKRGHWKKIIDSAQTRDAVRKLERGENERDWGNRRNHSRK